MASARTHTKVAAPSAPSARSNRSAFEPPTVRIGPSVPFARIRRPWTIGFEPSTHQPTMADPSAATTSFGKQASRPDADRVRTEPSEPLRPIMRAWIRPSPPVQRVHTASEPFGTGATRTS